MSDSKAQNADRTEGSSSFVIDDGVATTVFDSDSLSSISSEGDAGVDVIGVDAGMDGGVEDSGVDAGVAGVDGSGGDAEVIGSVTDASVEDSGDAIASQSTDGIRRGSSPNFCPPVEEGMVVSLKDDKGDVLDMEFLGLVLDDERSYGFFFPLDDASPLESGEVVVLQVNSVDENGQPVDFEMIADETEAVRIFEIFKEVAKDIYTFE